MGMEKSKWEVQTLYVAKGDPELDLVFPQIYGHRSIFCKQPDLETYSIKEVPQDRCEEFLMWV